MYLIKYIFTAYRVMISFDPVGVQRQPGQGMLYAHPPDRVYDLNILLSIISLTPVTNGQSSSFRSAICHISMTGLSQKV